MGVTKCKHDSAPPIRCATIEDYDHIVELWRASRLSVCLEGRESEAAFARQLEGLSDMYLVATDGDRIVGVVLGSHDHRKGWINRLAVLPEYRRRGIAAALVSACEAAIRRHGIEIVAVLIEPHNALSATVFENLGYRNDVAARYYRKLSRPGA